VQSGAGKRSRRQDGRHKKAATANCSGFSGIASATAAAYTFALTRLRGSLVDALGQLFLDASRLAAALTQVVQLGTAHITATLDFDLGDQGE
jgi:hypothetical protein